MNPSAPSAESQAPQRLLQQLVESLPINVIQKDREGRFVFANQRFCQAMGRSLDDLIGKTDFDLFPAVLAEKYRHDDQQVMAGGEPFEDIEEHRGPDGHKVYVQVLKAPLRDAAGQIAGIQAMFWDVTPRKRAEEALRESEARLRAVIETTLDCIVTTDSQGRIAEFNPAAQQTFGYSREEVVGRNAQDLLFPLDSPGRQHIDLQHLNGSRGPASLLGRRQEVPAVRKSGEEFLAEMAMQASQFNGNSVLTIFLRDVTERKRAEQVLHDVNQRLTTLIEASPLGILALDATRWLNERGSLHHWPDQPRTG